MVYIVMLSVLMQPLTASYGNDYSTGARLDYIYRLCWDMIPVNVNVTSDAMVGGMVEESIASTPIATVELGIIGKGVT